MIKKIKGEEWKTISFPGHKTLRSRYAVSSSGRVASFKNSVYEDGKILKCSITAGYKTLNLHVEQGNLTIYVHKEIAKKFCKKLSRKQQFVIHINHKKTDNLVVNLRWVTAEELTNHQQNSPSVIAYKHWQANRNVGVKLTVAKVKKIKAMIANPARRLTYKQLAEKYSVSPMTLYRIKSGENWSKVK